MWKKNNNIFVNIASMIYTYVLPVNRVIWFDAKLKLVCLEVHVCAHAFMYYNFYV